MRPPVARATYATTPRRRCPAVAGAGVEPPGPSLSRPVLQVPTGSNRDTSSARSGRSAEEEPHDRVWRPGRRERRVRAPAPWADADPWVGRAGPRGVVHLGVDRGRLDPVVERPPGLACVGHRRHRSRGLQIPRARDRLQLQGPAGRTSASGDLDHADVEQVWAYSLIVTNLDISTPEKARSVECWHRHRTDIE